MTIDRKVFFAYAKKSPFGNRLSQEQVDGMEEILAHWEGHPNNADIRHLAYMLATVFHETGGKMIPVREGFGKNDSEARKRVAGRAYAVEDPKTKKMYYGRGLVQITWKRNYAVLSELVGCDLVSNPDLALDKKIAVDILFEGMMRGTSSKGDFTGKSLEDYFNDTKDDPVSARKIINGKDKAELIASYHRAFLDSIKAATSERDENEELDAAPNGANLLSDKTMIGALTAGGGGVVSSLLGAIGNPWAFGAFAIVAVGIFLVVTGRIEIKHKAGA